MGYQPPSLVNIHEFIRNLETTTHSERKGAIENLKPLLEIKEIDTVLGGIIFEAEKIAVEYNRIPLLSSIYSATRSDLYNELNAGLNNTPENILDAKQKIIYLLRYYEVRKNHLAESKEEKASTSLEAEFKSVVDNVLSQIPDLKKSLAERPSLNAISIRLKKKPEEYAEECKKRSLLNQASADHIKFSKLMQFMTSPMMETIIASIEDCKTKQEQDQFKYSVYYGALLYIMKQIEYDCSGITTRWKENSSLYKFCQDTLCIENTDDIPDIVKLNFFVDFGKFVKCTRENKEAIKILKAIKLWDGYIKSTYFTDADCFLDTIATRLHTLLTEESYLWSGIKCLGNYAMQTLLVAICLEIGAGIYAAGVGVDVLPFILGKLGRYFMGGAVGERVAIMFAKQAEPAVMTNLFANGTLFLGKRVHTWLFPPIDPILSACEASKKFRSELHEEVTEVGKKPDRFLIALIELPSTIVPAAVKERLRGIFLVPIKTMVKEIEYKSASLRTA